jgi:hypothetical protein
MMSVVAVLLLISAFCVHAAEGGVTNLVVTASEVDPNSVKLAAAETRFPNVTFNYLNKAPEQVRAIYRRHEAVLVMKDGVIVAKAASCTGHKDRIGFDGHVDFAGLVLIFDDLNQARIAERILKRENRKPE